MRCSGSPGGEAWSLLSVPHSEVVTFDLAFKIKRNRDNLSQRNRVLIQREQFVEEAVSRVSKSCRMIRAFVNENQEVESLFAL